MKSLKLIVAILLIPAFSFGIDYYRPGDTLWIWAKSGLNLRDAPNLHGTIIGKLPNGSRVVTLEYCSGDSDLVVSEKPECSSEEIVERNFRIAGRYVKVRWGNVTGYLFDGYLSKLPTIVKNKNLDYRGTYEEPFYVEEFKKHFALLSVETYQDPMDPTDEAYHHKKYLFEKGVMLNYYYGKGFEFEIILPLGISLEEAFLFYLHVHAASEDCIVDQTDSSISIERSSGHLTISKVGSVIVMNEVEYGC